MLPRIFRVGRGTWQNRRVSSLLSYAERYRKELLESVIPFWLRHSLDREFGGYFTCLDRDGSVFDTRKYIWLQGRNVWVFSKLYNEVEKRAEWLEAATLGVDFLRKFARDPHGRYYFSLTREGKPSAFQRKPYAAAFVALGLIEYSRASGDQQARAEAEAIFWKIVEWIAHPELLGRPVYSGQQPASTLSDILVQVMLVLELLREDNDDRYREIADRCLRAALRHIDPDRNILLENVPANGPTSFDTPEARLFSAGSAVEVCWFLLHLLDRFPNAALQARILDVMHASLEFGWDGEYGGLHYFQDVEDKPMLQLEWNMKLWWCHTEAIYASVLAYTKTRDQKWMDWLERLDQYAFAHFADPEYGEWFGYLDRYGQRTSSLKGNNYKGAYHVSRFLLFSAQRIETFSSENERPVAAR